jgi:predicted Ser/Thr protein kinase
LGELEQLSRANLGSYTLRLLYRARNWSKADVTLVKVDGRARVVKDTAPRIWLVRYLFGRRLLQREFQVLQRLNGMGGVPHVYKMLDEDAFVMDYIEGINMGTLREVGETTVQRLSVLFQELHQRGVAHGDPHASNILVTADGTPFLIDFSTALARPESHHGWRERLWQELRRQDDRRLAKMKQRFAPHLLTEEEKQLLSEPSRLYRVSKSFRHAWEWLTLKPFRKRWKKWRRRQAVSSEQ